MSSNLMPLPALARDPPRSSIVPRQVDLKAKTQKPQHTDENELEGEQDMGGK
jgi:hypothetical protein